MTDNIDIEEIVLESNSGNELPKSLPSTSLVENNTGTIFYNLNLNPLFNYISRYLI